MSTAINPKVNLKKDYIQSKTDETQPFAALKKIKLDINPSFGFDFANRSKILHLKKANIASCMSYKYFKPINKISKIAGYILGLNIVVGITRIALNSLWLLKASKENRAPLYKQIAYGALETILGPLLLPIDILVYLKERKIADEIIKKVDLEKSLNDKSLLDLVNNTPAFNFYGFDSDPNVRLTNLDVRPNNLFFDALKERTTTPNNNGVLFGFLRPLKAVRDYIFNLKDNHIISFSANGKKATRYAYENNKLVCYKNQSLSQYLGTNIFKISAKEVKDMLNSQKVIVSSLIPKSFYLGLKKTFDKIDLVTLFGHEGNMCTMQDLATNGPKEIQDFFKDVQKNPKKYGFENNKTMLNFNQVMDLTLYQLGSMIIKTDHYYSFVTDGYKIRQREANSKDEIKLISASGIRGFSTKTNLQVKGNSDNSIDKKIMTNTYKAAFEESENGLAVFPAVGMGVWGGDPDIYWRAFFDGIISAKSAPKKIFVNPRHRNTKYGRYKNHDGNEFDKILQEYRKKYPHNQRLKNIVNLYDTKTDLLILAQNLKSKFSNETVSLFNASDPDVTLGNHVGEYVNNICHADTTEENFTAAGSNFAFEGLTKVREDASRVIQAD